MQDLRELLVILAALLGTAAVCGLDSLLRAVPHWDCLPLLYLNTGVMSLLGHLASRRSDCSGRELEARSSFIRVTPNRAAPQTHSRTRHHIFWRAPLPATAPIVLRAVASNQI